MKKTQLGQRIRFHRSRNGFSQELLAEEAGVSLRTVQRIESGEAGPRGDTLKRLAKAMNLTPDELLDWTVQEDRGFLLALNLSALGFILFPLVGVLLPMLMWLSKKDQIRGVDQTGKELMNFQISWTLFFFAGLIAGFIWLVGLIQQPVNPDFGLMRLAVGLNWGFIGLMYLYNIILILANAARINKGKKVRYFPKVTFMN